MADQRPSERQRPVVLCILDGWGYREEPADNAVAQARKPVFDRLWGSCPSSLLHACGEDVGLPAGQIGNSEVGHMNLGAGRVVLQELPKIDKAIADGELPQNPAILALVRALKETGGACHIMGLASPGGVHSHQDHMTALARTLSGLGVRVQLHLFTDGRDVPPRSAHDQVARFLEDIQSIEGVRVATVSGRYFAMDRDKRWDRVAKAYGAIVLAEGRTAADPLSAIERSYAENTGDEFIVPTVMNGYEGMTDGDGILVANFRSDRVREILTALLVPQFDGFDRPRTVRVAYALGMAAYSEELNAYMSAIFPPRSLERVIGEVIAEAGLTQLRIAETEKYAHVTFFFNGGEETQYAGEERILVPSPKVATYDLKPEMSAFEVTDRVVAAIEEDRFDFVVINYANPDMVGHTGDIAAAIKAVETVDSCLGRLVNAVVERGGLLLVTADHGNCELMYDEVSKGPHTAHTLDPVPLFLVNGPPTIRALRPGRLADIAPTLLELMGLPKPTEMTGQSLLAR